MSTNIYSIDQKLSEIFQMPESNIPNSVFEELPDDLVRFNPELSREEALKRNAIQMTCPKCRVFGQGVNMKRWHFDNCKTQLKTCEQCDEIIPRQGIKDFQYNHKKYCNRKCYMESKKGKAPIEMTDEVKQKISQKQFDYWKTKREL
jgi:hypothetical protein